MINDQYIRRLNGWAESFSMYQVDLGFHYTSPPKHLYVCLLKANELISLHPRYFSNYEDEKE